MSPGTLIAFFSKRTDARQSLWALSKKGYKQAAVLHRLPGGDISITDLYTWFRLFGILASVTVFALLVPLFEKSGTLDLLTRQGYPLHTLILSGAIIGLVFGICWFRRLKYGIEPRVLDRYVHCLLPEESALVLQGAVDAMKLPMSLIRDESESLPTIFVLHPSREHRDTVRQLDETLSDDFPLWNVIEDFDYDQLFRTELEAYKQRHADDQPEEAPAT